MLLARCTCGALGSMDGAARDPNEPDAAQPARPGLLIGGVVFASEDIAAVSQEADAYTLEPVVVLTFSKAGQRKFASVQQGHIGEALEFLFDGELISSPVLVEEIEGPTVHIAGLSGEDAAAVVARLGPAEPAR